MAEKNQDTDRLRALLRQVALPSPPADFTREVMRETALGDDKVERESYLGRMLQEIPLAEPPYDFTHKVQKAIREQSTLQPKPIIGAGVWISIVFFLTACMVLPILLPSTPSNTEAPVYFSWLATEVVNFTTAFREPILYLEVIVLSSALLLGLEKILLKRLHLKHSS